MPDMPHICEMSFSLIESLKLAACKHAVEPPHTYCCKLGQACLLSGKRTDGVAWQARTHQIVIPVVVEACLTLLHPPPHPPLSMLECLLVHFSTEGQAALGGFVLSHIERGFIMVQSVCLVACPPLSACSASAKFQRMNLFYCNRSM